MVGEGRVEATLFVEYSLVELADIEKLRVIKDKVRKAGGTIKPRPTVKPIYRNASIGWFLPQCESDSE